MKPIEIHLYEGAYAIVNPVNRTIEYHSAIDDRVRDERVKKELVLICWYYIQTYDETKSVPPFEDARRFAALVAIRKEAFGDLTKWSIDDLVREADVTEEFAQFRISLEVQQN